MRNQDNVYLDTEADDFLKEISTTLVFCPTLRKN